MNVRRSVLFTLASALFLALFVFLSVPARAASVTVERGDKTPSRTDYDVKVTIKVTEDADGWNDAYVAVNYKSYNASSDAANGMTKKSGLKNDFDNKSEFSYEFTNTGFPSSVEIYTDFGGGMTWRSFQADVTVYVNGTNVASKHITASSVAWSSSNAKNTVTVDSSKYPYPVKLYLSGVHEAEEVSGNEWSGEITASLADQYGSAWEGRGVTLKDSLGSDLGSPYPEYIKPSFDSDLRYYIYRSSLKLQGPEDKKVTYTYRIPTGNSVEGTVEASFTVDYRFMHQVQIVYDGLVKDTVYGSAGTVITLDYPELISTGFDLEWSLEGGGLLDTADPDHAEYVFGTEDGTLTAAKVPYSFTLVFDGNGASKGTMASRIQRVGSTYTLPGNTFTNTGYEFIGWNTKADGSGTNYANKSPVTNLSTVKGDTVTLYAQWKIKTYTVTFVNKMTNERIKQTVEYGGDALAPEIEAISLNENEHYVFSKWNKAYTNVKSNITVTSVHVKEPHSFEEKGSEQHCTVCGYRKNAAMTASIIGSGLWIIVIGGIGVLAIAVVMLALYRKKKQKI